MNLVNWTEIINYICHTTIFLIPLSNGAVIKIKLNNYILILESLTELGLLGNELSWWCYIWNARISKVFKHHKKKMFWFNSNDLRTIRFNILPHYYSQRILMS